AAASDDRDLGAAATAVEGLALIENDAAAAGLSRLDDAATAAAEGTLSARATALVYCVVIGACHQGWELGRAREWTRALAGWCDRQPEFTGAYRGLCRVYRARLLVQAGDWPAAVREAQLACQQLTAGYGESEAGAAYYQLGDAHRLRGELAAADEAYR